MFRLFSLTVACGLVLSMSLAGCGKGSDAPDLLSVIDVVPREVDVGDRIEVLGINLPSGEAKEAKVTFRGELRRPGQAPLGRSIRPLIFLIQDRLSFFVVGVVVDVYVYECRQAGVWVV